MESMALVEMHLQERPTATSCWHGAARTLSGDAVRSEPFSNFPKQSNWENFSCTSNGGVCVLFVWRVIQWSVATTLVLSSVWNPLAVLIIIHCMLLLSIAIKQWQRPCHHRRGLRLRCAPNHCVVVAVETTQQQQQQQQQQLHRKRLSFRGCWHSVWCGSWGVRFMWPCAFIIDTCFFNKASLWWNITHGPCLPKQLSWHNTNNNNSNNLSYETD